MLYFPNDTKAVNEFGAKIHYQCRPGYGFTTNDLYNEVKEIKCGDSTLFYTAYTRKTGKTIFKSIYFEMHFSNKLNV